MRQIAPPFAVAHADFTAKARYNLLCLPVEQLEQFLLQRAITQRLP
jgi:hypothetical protein